MVSQFCADFSCMEVKGDFVVYWFCSMLASIEVVRLEVGASRMVVVDLL